MKTSGGCVKKRQVDHVLRAAGKIAGDTEFIIIGSQALHATQPDLVDEVFVSAEVDLIAKNHPEATEYLNAIGVDSKFHEEFGYYADPVDRNTAKLPKGWESRLVPLPPGQTDGVTGLCLELHDLAIAKYAAGREKDTIFVKALVDRGLIERDKLLERLRETKIPDALRMRVRARINADFISPARPARGRGRR
jgi:hypothetical protein